MAWRIHANVQDANDCNAVRRDAKVNHVPFNTSARVRRYSGTHGQHPLLEGSSIEGSWFPAGLTFNQRSANGFNFGATLLFAPDQVADAFAVVGVMSSVNLRFNSGVLLVGQSDGLAHGAQDVLSKVNISSMNNSYY